MKLVIVVFARSCVVLFPVLFWHLFWRHPCVEDAVPVSKVWLRIVLLDAKLLVVDVMVCSVVAKERL